MPKYYSTSKKLPISDLKNFISLFLVFALVIFCTTKNFFSSPSEYQENKIDLDISEKKYKYEDNTYDIIEDCQYKDKIYSKYT